MCQEAAGRSRCYRRQRRRSRGCPRLRSRCYCRCRRRDEVMPLPNPALAVLSVPSANAMSWLAAQPGVALLPVPTGGGESVCRPTRRWRCCRCRRRMRVKKGRPTRLAALLPCRRRMRRQRDRPARWRACYRCRRRTARSPKPPVALALAPLPMAIAMSPEARVGGGGVVHGGEQVHPVDGDLHVQRRWVGGD